ncbi:gamma-glutamyl-phosphate reductase, partial [Flavihumibacter sediminis]|nr:gamma-glutamyl-phosphate reductase [Flavihumibacter sediminis]
MINITNSLQKTHKAARTLQTLSNSAIQKLLLDLAKALEEKQSALLKANASDLSRQPTDNPRNDRLLLNEQRIKNIAASMRKVAKLPDPTGRILEER